MKDYYDEKQVQDRGRAYKNAFISSIVLCFILYFVDRFASIESETVNVISLLLFIPLAVCLLTMIKYDALDALNNTKNKRLMLLLFILALLLTAFIVYGLIQEGTAFVYEHGRFNNGLTIIIGTIFFYVTSIYYWIRRKRESLTE